MVKKECFGHVQKRMGTRLCKLVKNYKKVSPKILKVLANKVKKVEAAQVNKGKRAQVEKAPKQQGLGGKGRLTGKWIDKFSCYYGNAICDNIQFDSTQKMKDAVLVTYHHYNSTDDKQCHDNCPPGENSWFPYQAAKAANQKHPSNTPIRPCKLMCYKQSSPSMKI